MSTSLRRLLCLVAPGLLVACSDVEEDDKHGSHSHGLVTRVGLTFTPTDGGDPVFVEWADPELDGDPLIDDLVLDSESADGDHVPRAYELELEFWNDLEDPAGDVTTEIVAGGTEHWLFFTGSAVEGPASVDNPDALLSQETLDTDADGLPLGLVNDVETLAAGTGDLVVTLRHMVPVDGEATKVEGLDAQVSAEGFSSIPGGNDVQVVFPVEVL